MARLLRGGGAPACRVEAWNLMDSKQLEDFHCANAIAIALDPRGHLLALMEDGPMARVEAWDIDNTSLHWTANLVFKASLKVGTLLAFSADGSRLIVGGDKNAIVLDAASGAAVGPPLDFGAGLANVALDAAGRRAAIALDNRTVVLADAESGARLRTLPFASDSVGYGGLAFSEDGQQIVAAFGDSNVNNPRVWKWFVDPEALGKGLSFRLAPILAADGAASN
jgi:WD40 repeat protein